MKHFFSAVLCLLLLSQNTSAQTKPAAKPTAAVPAKAIELKTLKDSMSYYIGIRSAITAQYSGIDKPDMKLVEAGINDYLKGQAQYPDKDLIVEINRIISLEEKKIANKNLIAADKFMRENERKPGILSIGYGEIQYIITDPPRKPIEPGKFHQIEVAEYAPVASYTFDITVKLMDNSVIYQKKNLKLDGSAKVSYLPRELEQCLYSLKVNESGTFYMLPVYGYGSQFVNDINLKKIVPPNSLIICDIKMNERINEEEGERYDDIGESTIAPVFMEEYREDEPVMFASQMPLYPGGEPQMNLDIQKNLVYSEADKTAGRTGVAYVQFVVEKDGRVLGHEVHLIRSVAGGSKQMDKAAVDAVKKLKAFQPAKQNGVPVRLRMTVPVKFEIK